MKCTSCGCELTDGDHFCCVCGQKVEALPSPAPNPRNTFVAGGDIHIGPTEEPVPCGICGSFPALQDRFKCKLCERTFCVIHRDPYSYLCPACEADSQRKQRELRERSEAQAYATRLAQQARQNRARVLRCRGNCLHLRLDETLEMEFMRIPAGEFRMGSHETPQEKPVHSVQLAEFWLGRYPVTNSQYRVFVQHNQQRLPDHWKKGEMPAGKENHPVVWVNWHEAQAFCNWLGGQLNLCIQLPSEAQWEKAARGTDEWRYPWGGRPPEPGLCNWEGGGAGDTMPVGSFSPAGDSPFGCADMAGQVEEWVRDWYHRAYYLEAAPADPPGPPAGEERVLRGGSWFDNENFIRASHRGHCPPGTRKPNIGFRCALMLEPGGV